MDIQNTSSQEPSEVVQSMPPEFASRLEEEIDSAGGEWKQGVEFEGAIGRTMYDTPTSKDNTVTVLLPPDEISRVPSQSLVRIKSRPKDKGGDGRQYLGAVVEGPFAEPDGLRADAPIVVTTTVRGAMFTPRYHGRVQVQILGEETDGGSEPPRFRPRPNSPVFVLDEPEMRAMLGVEGDIDVGFAVGFESLRVQFPSRSKAVLPRHLGVLGTTGGGKSTTVSGLIHQFQKAGIAAVLIDTEGEYTEIGQPTMDEKMIRLLKKIDRKPEGVPNVHVYHLIGRGTTASAPTPTHPFKLDFSSLSPYAAAEVLDLTPAQHDRFFKAYDVTKWVLRDLSVYPRKGNKAEEKEALELDELETGYPRMTLSHLLDVVNFFFHSISGGEHEPFNPIFQGDDAQAQIKKRIAQVQTDSPGSWRALLSKLWQLQRPGVFDNPNASAIPFTHVVQPGMTTIIDLSDTDSPYIRNLVIAHLLRGLQVQQELAYEAAKKKNQAPTPVMIVIEEAHEFLSRERIEKMQTLFGQVARIARRGRKRWLGMAFITQLPQHLPDEVLGLINNYILHKIADSNVISRLKRSIGGIDEGLWDRLPNLAPGQAIVKVEGMARPLLAAIDPTPCKLRMVE